MSKKKQNLNYKVLISIEELENFINNEEFKENENNWKRWARKLKTKNLSHKIFLYSNFIIRLRCKKYGNKTCCKTEKGKESCACCG